MIKKNNPTVSVIMPVFNAETYLEQAIISILEQSYTDFEFIIIDDGSSDNSLSIINKIADSDNRVKFISRPNKGLIFTLNEAINLSVGDYIARMDADDISAPQRFEKQVSFLDAHPDYAAVGVLSILIDSDGDEIAAFGNWVEHDDIDKAHIRGHGGAIIHPSSMIRAEVLRKVGNYREGFKSAEDIDLWLRVAEVGKLANIDERLFYYRQHLDSVGHKQRTEQILNTQKAIADAYQRRQLKADDDFSTTFKNTSDTKIDTFLKWGWWALSAGNRKTARKYAFKSVIFSPLRTGCWKLLICSLRGY